MSVTPTPIRDFLSRLRDDPSFRSVFYEDPVSILKESGIDLGENAALEVRDLVNENKDCLERLLGPRGVVPT